MRKTKRFHYFILFSSCGVFANCWATHRKYNLSLICDILPAFPLTYVRSGDWTKSKYLPMSQSQKKRIANGSVVRERHWFTMLFLVCIQYLKSYLTRACIKTAIKTRNSHEQRWLWFHYKMYFFKRLSVRVAVPEAILNMSDNLSNVIVIANNVVYCPWALSTLFFYYFTLSAQLKVVALRPSRAKLNKFCTSLTIFWVTFFVLLRIS